MILVTGSTGIVGSRLVFDLLSANKQVRAMRRPNSDLDFMRAVFLFYDPSKGAELFDKINWAIGDLLDIDSLEQAIDGVEEIYHTAAMVSYQAKDATELLRLNVDGTANVVNLALDAGVRKICHISSVAALGKAAAGNLITEETQWKKEDANSVYGLSKFLAEREVWRGTAEGLPAVIVNPSVILAPSKPDQSSGQLMALLQKENKYAPKGTAGFVDVRDVGRMCTALMDSSIENQKFILSAENLKYRDLLNEAAEIFGKSRPNTTLQPWILELGWRLASVASVFSRQKPLVTKETARAVSRTSRYDSAKIEQTLKTNFTSVSASLKYYRAFYDSQH